MSDSHSAGDIQVRELKSTEEFAGAVHLEKVIWGWADLDLLPVRFFVVASTIGGQVLGAFDRDLLIGFCLAIPGVKPDGKVYLHSHMLGVLPEYRDAGAGRRMKMAQKEAALARGIELIEWTFDPLETKNAFFNIERLGVVIRRYQPNMYGVVPSQFQQALPTDRCIAEWHLTRERVRRPEEGRVTVPAGMTAIKRNEPEFAAEIQQRVGREFQALFAQGLVVTAFERGEHESSYIFTKWDTK
jgi:predicted GNAT superfamily acetyltransferase